MRSRNPQLTNHQQRLIALSGMYAYQQGASYDRLSPSLKRSGRHLLEQGWEIANRDDFLTRAESLLSAASDIAFSVAATATQDEIGEIKRRFITYPIDDRNVFDAFNEINVSTLPPEQQRLHNQWSIFRLHRITQVAIELRITDLDSVLRAHDRLVTNYGLLGRLFDHKLITSVSDLHQLGSTAWDKGRLAFITRLAYEQKLITLDESWEILQTCYQAVHKKYANWIQFANSYIIGRELWANNIENFSDLRGFISVRNWLLKDPRSPWLRVTFHP